MPMPNVTFFGFGLVKMTVPEYPFFSATFQNVVYSFAHNGATRSGLALCSWRQRMSGFSDFTKSRSPLRRIARMPLTFQEMSFMTGAQCNRSDFPWQARAAMDSSKITPPVANDSPACSPAIADSARLCKQTRPAKESDPGCDWLSCRVRRATVYRDSRHTERGNRPPCEYWHPWDSGSARGRHSHVRRASPAPRERGY